MPFPQNSIKGRNKTVAISHLVLENLRKPHFCFRALVFGSHPSWHLRRRKPCFLKVSTIHTSLGHGGVKRDAPISPPINILSKGSDCSCLQGRQEGRAELGKCLLLAAQAPGAVKHSSATSHTLSAALASNHPLPSNGDLGAC